MKLPFLIVIGTFMFVSTHTKKPNQRYLTAEGTLPFFGRMPDGEVRAFEVPSFANLGDVYRAIETTADCFVGSITLNGQTLSNDDQTLVADAGMSAECVIDVLLEPPNDLQILDRAVENPDVNLWPCLGSDPYQSLVSAADSLGMNVMLFVECWLSDHRLKLEDGKIVGLNFCNTFTVEACTDAAVDLNVLSKLTNLSELTVLRVLEPNKDLYLAGLERMKKIREITLFLESVHDQTTVVIIPDMSQCTQLEKIRIVMFGEGADSLLAVDCSGSNLRKEVFQRSSTKIDFMWDCLSD